MNLFFKSSILFLILSLLTSTSCKSDKAGSVQKFDAKKWLVWSEADRSYTYRKFMYKDLVESGSLNNIKKTALTDMIGMPNSMDTSIYTYTISQKWVGNWRFYWLRMDVKLQGDSIVEWVRVLD